MKQRFFFFVLFLFLNFYIFSQERVSNIVSDGTLSLDYVKTVDSVNYLIRIYPNDDIFVYTIEGKDSMIERYIRNIPGAYTDYYKNFTGRYLKISIFNQGIVNIYVYNFVNDEIDVFGQQEKLKYVHIHGDFAFLYIIKDENIEETFLYNLKSKERKKISHDDKFVAGFNDYFIFKGVDDTINREVYYLYDFYTGQKDVFFNDITSGYIMYPLIENDTLIYISPYGELVKYDIANKTESKKPLISNPFAKKLKLFSNDGFYYVIESDSHRILMFKVDKKNEIIIAKYNYNYSALELYFDFYLANDKIIGYGFDGVLIVDVEKNKHIVLDNFHPENVWKNICDEIFIYQFLDKLVVVDLNDLTTKSILAEEFSSRFTYVALDNDLYFIVLKDNLLSIKTLYYLDNQNNKFEYAKNMDRLNPGAKKISLLNLFKDKPFVTDGDIYYVQNEEELKTKKLTDFSFTYYFFLENYKITDNALYFVNKDTATSYSKMMSFDGENIKEIIDFTKYDSLFFDFYSLYDFEIVDNILYFCNQNGFYSYNMDSHQIKKIIEGNLVDGLFYNDYIAKIDKDIFYKYNKKLYVIRNNGNPEIIDVGEQSDEYFLEPFELKNKLFYLNGNTLYEVKTDETVEIFNFPFSLHVNFPYGNFFIDNNHENVFLILNNNYLYHFDGNTIDSFYMESNSISRWQLSEEYFLLDQDKNLLFNCKSKKLNEVTSLDFEDQLSDVIISGKDTFLVAISGYKNIKIYKAKDNFAELDLYKEFYSDALVSINIYSGYGKFGILYVGNDIYFKDDQNDFFLMENLIDISSQNMVKDSFIYFMAADLQHGNQIYRVKMKTGLLYVDDYTVNRIAIYPNPAHNYLEVGNRESYGAKSKYIIYDNIGNMVKEGKQEGKIDISSLNKGIYYILLLNNAEKAAGRFIKF